jgi:hypothetical protein
MVPCRMEGGLSPLYPNNHLSNYIVHTLLSSIGLLEFIVLHRYKV